MALVAADQLADGLGLDQLIDHTGAAVGLYDVVGDGGGYAHDEGLLGQGLLLLNLLLLHPGVVQLDDGLVVQAEYLTAGAGADAVAALHAQLPHGAGDVHDFGEAGDIKDIHHLVVDIDDAEDLPLTALFGRQQHPQAG